MALLDPLRELLQEGVEHKALMHYDDVLRRLGEFGRYQRFQYFLVCLVSITSSFHSMNMVFVGPTPKHRCNAVTPEQWTNISLTTQEQRSLTYPLIDGEPEKCKVFNMSDIDWSLGNLSTWRNVNRTVINPCPNGWTYDTDVYKSTIVSEWDLVCTDSWKRSTASTIFFAGRLVGAFVSGQLSDRFGRRPVFFVSVILQAIVGCVAALSPTLWFFYIFYFIQGLLQVAVYLSSYVLGTELVGARYRKLAGISCNFFYALGQMILVGIAYGLKEWRWIEIAISLPPLLFISYYWLLPESIRWLLTVGRRDEAAVILEKVSKMNRVPLEKDIAYKIDVSSGKDENKRYTVIDILKRRRIAFIAINIWFNWLANALVYYGISLNTSNLGSDPYLNFFISACVEIPSLIFSILLLDRIGRRRIYLLFLLIAAAGCISTAFVPKDMQWLVITLSMIGKFGISGSYAVIYLMAAEVFPTVVRNVGVGMSSVFSRIGGMVAPQIVLLGTIAAPLPQITFGVFALLAMIGGFFLPETAGKDLAENLEDMDDKLRNKSEEDKKSNDKFPEENQDDERTTRF